MTIPNWLANRVLADAAIATASARQTAAEIHRQGRDHYDDPTWRAAVALAHRATDKAEEIGISPQAVLDASKARSSDQGDEI
ncbi:hypothetical protein TR51_27375 [Kitasatospora griseola]|uniref:Uncharacterized protein n=1 Tax=Kitasatospora griseola TaxID=2064 RepID=A0A0D0N3Q5_KITGR|nr:hypothetical protein [Kitasatospora griseola]KIQ62690.1 hypothetical protein TR51_27375 [Kitasatospora griseola]